MSEAKIKAKERDGYECVFCGMDNESHRQKHGRGVHAHHIIKERDNGADDPRNYITVCRGCHTTIEKTQASAISQIRENIISSTQDNTDGLMMQAKIVDVLRMLAEATTGVDVRQDYYYEHIEYGIVRVESFTEETIGARVGGTVKEVIVNFTRQESDMRAGLSEPLSHFVAKTSDGEKQSYEFNRESAK